MALINCPECKKEVSDAARACVHCGYPLKKSLTPEEEFEFLRLCDEIEELASDDDDDDLDLLLDKEEFLCCPRCYSSNLTPMKKGFGFGKAAVGMLAVGVYGIAAGSIGMNNVNLFCNGCGNRFKSNNAISLTRFQQKYYKENLL